ncbi:MAG: metallophosphoesterase [archaeon]
MQDILTYAEKKGIIISKESAELLSKKEDWQKIIDELIAEGHFVVELSILEKKLTHTKLDSASVEIEVKKASFASQARDRPPNFHVMEEYDVTGQSNSEGTVQDFLRLFRSKFEILSGMLKSRHNLSPVTVEVLLKRPDNQMVDVIGIVNRKWITKKGHTAYEIEDMTGKCIALVMESDREMIRKAERILEDNVVGVKGSKKGELVLVKEIYWPDLPIRPPKTIRDEVIVGAISDLHIGSKLFYEEQFIKFLDYINGQGLTPAQLERVGKIQYLFVTGDNVAGIGVYPGQYDELVIKDVYGQYKVFEDLMLRIPEYIQVFICPGQHDAVRRAEPQPAIDKEFVPRLSKLKNFHFIASPSWVEIEGLKVLVYHGPSVHDLISSVSFLEMSKPQDGMVELLKKRDLMPKYGGKNPYVPEKKDYMVIKEEPDLVFFGDMHHNGYAMYRGTSIINSGTWEAQSDFQKKMGHNPTPCIFSTINLATRKITETHFLRDPVEREINE